MNPAPVANATPEPVQQIGGALLIQGSAALRALHYCAHAGVQRRYRERRSTRDLEALKMVIRRTEMFANEHDSSVYVVSESHSESQNVADLMSVADAAKELNYSPQHVRRLIHAGHLERESITRMLVRAHVLALKARRKR